MSCISQLLALKGDDKALIIKDEPLAIEGGGSYKGYDYLITFNHNGHRCGYVSLPTEHPYSQTPEEERTFLGGKPYKHWDYESLDITCHGGLTFMSPEHFLKDLISVHCNDILIGFDNDIWIGFDCGHHDDMPDLIAFKEYFDNELYEKRKSFFDAISLQDVHITKTVKDYKYVENECMSIINQLIKLAT